MASSLRRLFTPAALGWIKKAGMHFVFFFLTFSKSNFYINMLFPRMILGIEWKNYMYLLTLHTHVSESLRAFMLIFSITLLNKK